MISLDPGHSLRENIEPNNVFPEEDSGFNSVPTNGMLIFSKAEHPSKQYLPKLVTLEGISMDFKLVQPEKARTPTDFNCFGNSISCRLEQQ